MKKAKKSPKKQVARESLDVEKQVDSRDPDVEEHVLPLLQSIGNLKLERIDLSTRQSALNTIPAINEVLEKISVYQRAASTLRSLLEEKRDFIIKNSQ
ncbi:MAG: hypothetical protein J5J00_00495 [Deltaproteobacteria bacterium]|nr:hypothetical protein [Deltaproteobacteria bacterium]